MYQVYKLRNAYSTYQQRQSTLQKFRPQLEQDCIDTTLIADVFNAAGRETLSLSLSLS